MKKQMFLFMAIAIVLLVILPQTEVWAYHAPARDRLPGEGFWHWLWAALNPDFS